MSKVAFLGMGVMGYPMAGHIAAAGHEVLSITGRRPNPKHGLPSMVGRRR